RLRFWLSSHNSFVFVWFYRYLYTPKPGSLPELLSNYSRWVGQPFTVVQIGANDGFNNDPIHKFIKRDNWQGVLLEPQKWVFDRFLTRIYQKNRGIQVIHAALGARDGFMPLYKISFSDARWATGLATFERPQLEKALASPYVDKQVAKEGVQRPARLEDQIVEEQVPVLKVSTLLDRYQIEQMDMLQIDTEGFDYQVIQLFDVAKTQPRLIVFESCHLSETAFRDCQQHLKTAGYAIRTLGPNTVAMHQPPEEFQAFFQG
ncbi:MAG: FkbM family methyltransferase, partial [Bacteroidota bacterium]